ncbi:cell division protein ZapE, partial [Vibrio anguillarum]|uniref:AFG1/ZapE family ATPase n=1 Tax=Vibrio anguillarum TaxID=55601 RepID=UPI00188AD969
HYQLDEAASHNLQHYYRQLVGDEKKEALSEIEINHRTLSVVKAGDGILYATFEQLCQTARSQNDYIELS